MSEIALELPPGHDLVSFAPRQVPAPGAIYLARMPGDLETLFGAAQKLRDRDFLLQIDGEPWLARPLPGIFGTYGEDGTVVGDTGGIHAGTNGEETTIDFQLTRPPG